MSCDKGKLIFAFAGLLILISCTPEACLDETEAFLKASFYSSAKNQASSPDSITVYGFGMDTSMIYSGSRKISMARLPLNPSADSSYFVININTGSDTLLVKHTSYPHLVSGECGYTFYHTLRGSPISSGDIIDSIRIINPEITTGNEENIRIYY